MTKSILAIGAAGLLAFSLAGCATQSAMSPAPTKDAAASSPSATPTPEAPKPSGVSAFGDTFTWENGVAVTVSEPVPFTPGEYAAGVDQTTNIVFTVTLTNGSDKNLEPMIYDRVSSGGVEASSIFDSGNPVGDIGGSPSTVVLPGQSITWLEAYSVADAGTITFQTSPSSFKYEDAIFTNIG